MSNPHEDRARDEKAKKLARLALRDCIDILRPDDGANFEADELIWGAMAKRAGVTVPSEQTRRRVVEILEGIAI